MEVVFELRCEGRDGVLQEKRRVKSREIEKNFEIWGLTKRMNLSELLCMGTQGKCTLEV